MHAVHCGEQVEKTVGRIQVAVYAPRGVQLLPRNHLADQEQYCQCTCNRQSWLDLLSRLPFTAALRLSSDTTILASTSMQGIGPQQGWLASGRQSGSSIRIVYALINRANIEVATARNVISATALLARVKRRSGYSVVSSL